LLGNSTATGNISTQNAQAMIGVLDTLGRWIDEIPPIQQPMRYGNKAFRTWHKKVKDVCIIDLMLEHASDLQSLSRMLDK
jgi:hypothetical protein